MKKHITSNPGLQKAPLLTLLLFFAMQVLYAQAFVTTWEVLATHPFIDIPGTGTNYNIDWEEVGNPVNHGTKIGNNATIVYVPTGGIYKVSITPGSGSFTQIKMFNSFWQDRLRSIEQWGSIAWSSMSFAFYDCHNMVYNATDVPDLSNVTDMSWMFYWCNKNFNGDLSGWNTSNVTDMSWMFYNANKFNGNIGTWNTANVTDMRYMFYDCRDFNQDIGGWNTANVTNMKAMFSYAQNFNQDIGSWNTALVTNMSDMFQWAQSFNQNLGNWQLNSVVDISNILLASDLSTDNYDQTLIGWNANPATPDGLTFSAWPARYCQAEAARNNLINVKGWTINDDGPVPNCCVPPSFSACPVNPITANTSSNQCNAVVTYTIPIAGYPAPSLNYTFTGATSGSGSGTGSGSTFNKGNTTVTITASNNCGTPTCVFTVTVNDGVPPAITCPGNATITANASCSGALGAYTPVSVSDNCTANPTVTQSPASGTALNGHNNSKTVTLTADDGNGNTQACSFTVTLKDQTKPGITCPANAIVTANASCSGTVGSFAPASVSDNCTANPTVTQSPASSTTLTGHNDSKTVTLTADDGNGNTQACSFTVTLKDQTKPSIICPANANVTANASCSGTIGSFAAASVSDNCTANPTVSQSPASSTVLNGHNDSKTVTLTADDGNGNTQACTFTVTLKDQAKPSITCPTNAIVAANASCSGTIGTIAPASVSDNCAANPTVTQSPAASTVLNGHNDSKTVTLTADDGNGNTQACSFTVTLKDQTKPSITCPDNLTVTPPVGQCTAAVTYTTPLGADNCSQVTVSHVSGGLSGATFPAGATTVIWQATDPANNNTTCSFTVTVNANTVPVITCPANIVQANTPGVCGSIVTFTAPTAPIVCGQPAPVTQTGGLPSGSTFPVGLSTVTYTATAPGGATGTCAFTVTINDTQPPTVTCPANAIIAANASCSGTLGSYAAVSVSDNCTANPTVTQSPASSTALNGHNDSKTVTLTADDGNGNTQACSFTVTLKDLTKPNISCPANAIVAANASCSGTVGSFAPASVSDNCSANPTVTQSPAASTALNGHNDSKTVTLTADDGNGNTQACSFTVTLKDQTKPSISCPANAIVAANASCSGTVGSFAPASVSDNCAASPTVTQSPASSTALNGHNDSKTVTLTADDGNGNTQACSFTVTLKDQTGPSITCPTNATVTANASCSGTVGSFAPASVSDNCSANPTVTQSPASSTALNGHNDAKTVTLTADDGNGNTQACSFTVTLKDQTKPSISCPANATVTANANCSGTVGSFAPASVSDNCTASPTVTQSPAASTVLSGHNDSKTVTLTADDGNGNTQACTFAVTLKDLTKPNITCPANAIVAANATCSGTVGSFAAASVSDNCTANPSVSQSPASSTVLSGHNDSKTVTLTADDGNGNTQACSFTVTLKDQTGPSLVCKPATVNLNAAGTGSITTASVYQSGSDNCGTVNLVSVSPSTFNCNNVGANTVTLTGNDGNGNNGTCTATVTVVDAIAPTLLCKNVTLSLNASGQATLTVGQINNGSYDNCGILAFGLSQSVFTCANIGNNNVTLSGRDRSNNTGQCTAVVTVTDPIVPLAKCKDLTANLGANGTVLVDPNWVNNGSSDNCSFNLSLTPNLFNCSNLGQNTVTLKATDAGGNTATCTAKVTVRDVTGPTAKCKNPTIYLDDSGQATLSAAQVNNGSSDNCGMGSMSVNKTAFDCSHISGTQSVTLSMTDVNGNSASCTSNVTVKDGMAPTAICEDVTVELGSNGIVVVYGAELASYSYDNCSVYSYSPIAKVYTAANMGANNLTITVKDWSNNSSTCVSVVTVVPAGNGNLQQYGGNGKSGNHGFGDFNVYPNPSSGEATMAFQLPAEQAFSFRIFDISGRMVYSQEDLGVEGENVMPLHLDGLLPGVYLIDLQSDNWKVQQRLVLQR